MSIFPYDLPGVPENNTPNVPYSPDAFALESHMYMPSKPYAQALTVGQLLHANDKWIGYQNQRVGWGRSDDNAYIVPKITINKHNFNAPVPYPTNASFAGQAPVKGIFTGIDDEVSTCR